ncbi:hypothetical protein, partial [Rodentibacter caecimuris]|uniref:hypothetical protein n=1 Tax=Rodentibacter caecimuris TaxID=1796644 RepID=UPI00195A0213
MAHFIDVKLSSLKIEKNYIKRTPPRKVEDQQKNYLELFDFDTIFSDIFFTGNKDIQFLGPPLINLKNELLNGEISINDVRINDLNFHDKNRITRTVYPFKEKLDNIPTFISFQNNLCSGSIQVQPNLSSFFKNRNVLVTQQKNNSLYWIAYWIAFHVQFHKIDAVIIYDNSSEY